MAKWADYLISAVKYNGDRTRVEGVRCFIDKGESLSEAFDIPRSKVIYLLEKGYSIVAIYKNIEGKWQRESRVRLFEIGGKKYIRTDTFNNPNDNLEGLPEYYGGES
ncbi:DUF3892 domain-containing protein [candidate division WOR-3 bacterium]|uniref:DUF3892 domain-containing protein n=1 Tax=candidate division WOR-3 bacterium TaxID=2052148 RepID=A0A9D5K7P8_UNCW3|nr:DUF3892 domain-containing protein [candidate division WOR-3 bacterium]MBD3363817.1 DUF3892 domain-containing protein [candidate division WOR-3 bacterium]